MSTAGEGGAWGIAALASYMAHKEQYESLADYLVDQVFHDDRQVVYPNSKDVHGFALFMERYTKGLAIEQVAADHFVENGLKKEAWGKGYATEGATACLQHGFDHLGFLDIYSFTAAINTPSSKVMSKIGMSYVKSFDHPKLEKDSPL